VQGYSRERKRGRGRPPLVVSASDRSCSPEPATACSPSLESGIGVGKVLIFFNYVGVRGWEMGSQERREIPRYLRGGGGREPYPRQSLVSTLFGSQASELHAPNPTATLGKWIWQRSGPSQPTNNSTTISSPPLSSEPRKVPPCKLGDEPRQASWRRRRHPLFQLIGLDAVSRFRELVPPDYLKQEVGSF